MEVVPNEWLLEYLRPNASKEERRFVLKFVDAWDNKYYKVVLKNPSPFFSKFCRFMKESGSDPGIKLWFRRLKLLIYDSDKTILLSENDLKQMPDQLRKLVKPDDEYLVELCYSRQNSIIVTMDGPLKEKLKEQRDVMVCLLTEFLEKYISE